MALLAKKYNQLEEVAVVAVDGLASNKKINN